MSEDSPVLNRGLFGYRRSTVNQIISDRDLMLRQAEGRVRASQAKIADLEAQLAALRGQNSRREQELRTLESRLEEMARRAEGVVGPGTRSDLLDEMSTEGSDAPAQPDVQELPGQAFPDQGGAMATTGEPPGDVIEEYGKYGEGERSPGSGEMDAESILDAVPDLQIGGYQPGEDELGQATVDEVVEAMADHSVLEEYLEAVVVEVCSYDEAGTPIEAEALSTEGSDALDAGSGSGEPDEPEIVDVEAFEVEPLSEPEAPAEAEPLMEAEPVMEPEPVSEPPMAEAPAAPAASGSPGMSTSKFVGDEIARIMSAAEEAAARIMERAQLFTQGQVAEANRLWREVQEELATLRAWREEITPQIEAVQTKVEEVRGRIDDVPERIREALAPMADSIASIDGDLAGLLAAASPPDLMAPSDLDTGESSQWTDRPDETASILQESPNGDGGSEDHS